MGTDKLLFSEFLIYFLVVEGGSKLVLNEKVHALSENFNGRFFRQFPQGRNFVWLPVRFTVLLKRGLLYKERICSRWEQILSLYSRPLFRKDKILTELPHLKMYPFPFLTASFIVNNRMP